MPAVLSDVDVGVHLGPLNPTWPPPHSTNSSLSQWGEVTLMKPIPGKGTPLSFLRERAEAQRWEGAWVCGVRARKKDL